MLPAGLILVCNLTILYKIRKCRHMRNRNTVNHAAQAKQNKTTCMLLILSFTYIVTLLPLVLLSIVIHISVTTNPSAARYILVNLKDLRCCLELISEINYGVNFYIKFYVMSEVQFRRLLKNMCSLRHQPPSNRRNIGELVVRFKRTATL